MRSSSASRSRGGAVQSEVERRPSGSPTFRSMHNERRRGLNFDEVGEEDDKQAPPPQIMNASLRVGDGLLDPDAYEIPDTSATAADTLVHENEYLALDNLLLQRKTAELERRLEIAAMQNTAGGSFVGALLGFPKVQDRALVDSAAELQARADENLQLQHELFEQRRKQASEAAALEKKRAALERTLRQALAEAEAELKEARVQAAAEAVGAEKQLAEQRANLESLHAVCMELRLKCASTLDELEASQGMISKLRQRDVEHQEWRARVRRAWRREQQERNELEAKRLLQEQAAEPVAKPPAEAAAVSAAAVAAASRSNGHTLSSGGGSEGGDEGSGGGREGRSSKDGDANVASADAAAAEDLAVAGSRSPRTDAHAESERRADSEAAPAWLQAAERAVSLPYITEALDSNDGTTEESSALLCADDETDPVALRTALVAERARREAAEAKAEQLTEELKLSSARFQQQIGMLSDALSEMHAKEEARKKRQAELREIQRQRQLQQQQQGGQRGQGRPQTREQPQDANQAQQQGMLGAAAGWASGVLGEGLSTGSLWSAK